MTRAPLSGITLLLAWLLTAAPGVAQQPSADSLIEQHCRAMKTVGDVFAANPMRIEYVEGNAADGKRVWMHWQGGKFRSELHWLGFVEVFAYDGKDNWYASDLSLPYSLDEGTGVDVTAQLASNFAHVTPVQVAYLGAATSVPLDLSKSYAVLRYAPPGMSEVLLLLDRQDYRLSGILQGTDRQLANSTVYREMLFEDWADFGPCWYPRVIRTRTLTSEGEEVKQRVLTTQSVAVTPPLPAVQFTRQSAPAVPRPSLPTVPLQIPFSFLNDTVVVKCTGPHGENLRFEVDTGAAVGLLRRDIARQLGLEPIGDEEVTGHGSSAWVGYARAEGIKLGGKVELPPWPAAVLGDKNGNHSLDDSLADHGVAGLLGNFILSNFVLQIDYRRRQIVLWPPESFDPDRDLIGAYHRIPCRRDSMPYVEVTIDGRLKGGAFFNTGAQQFFALSTWALDHAGLSYEVESVGLGVTVGGNTAFGLIRPKEVRMGDMVIQRPPTHLEMLAPGEAPNPHRIASFGNGFFQRYKVTFDLFHETYYIQTM
jgi:hypothetical protein